MKRFQVFFVFLVPGVSLFFFVLRLCVCGVLAACSLPVGCCALAAWGAALGGAASVVQAFRIVLPPLFLPAMLHGSLALGRCLYTHADLANAVTAGVATRPPDLGHPLVDAGL